MQFDGAGTNHKICFQEGTTALLESHVHWADLILVMEQKHKKAVEAITSSKVSSKIRVLQIPDHYVYYNEALIQILNEKVVPYLTL